MRTLQLALAAILIPSAAASLAADAPRPNILMIVGDDMGYADVGFQGCKDIPTPHLDALAASGVRFASGYVSGPYCSPTRAGLLTGRYQTRFGHEFNPGPAGTGLPLEQTTLANRLKAAGYATGIVGKWHLGSEAAQQPMQRGFDEFFGFLGGSHSYFNVGGIVRGNEPVKEMDYTTDAFGREAAAFIEKHKTGSPWLLCVTFNAVHTPMDATADRLDKFAGISNGKRRKYAAMMSAMDDAIGRVLKSLADSGQQQNTLVTFISDNGGPTMEGTTINGSSNAPLRGSKRTTLEGGIRVPYLVAWPGHIKPGVCEQPAIQLDLTATALAAAGLNPSSIAELDGVDLLPYLSGEKPGKPHEALFWRFGNQMAIRLGDYKLVRYDTTADGDAKQPIQATPARLYSLADDIGESRDLATAMPDKVQELQARWDDWNKANVKPLWGGGKGDSDGAEPSQPPTKKAQRKAAKKAARRL